MPPTKLSSLLADYHASLIGTLSRRKLPGRYDVWPTVELVALLNNRFQELLLQVIDLERSEDVKGEDK